MINNLRVISGKLPSRGMGVYFVPTSNSILTVPCHGIPCLRDTLKGVASRSLSTESVVHFLIFFFTVARSAGLISQIFLQFFG